MKKSGYHILLITIIYIIIMAVLSGCRPELCYNHFPQASVKLSWEQEWERDYGMNHLENWDADLHGCEYHAHRPGVPAWVNLVRYEHSGAVNEKYISAEGGDVVLESNDYKSFLFYNGDTEYIVLSDMASVSDARASATARSRSTIAYIEELYPDTRSTNPPDVLYSAYIEEVPKVESHDKKLFQVKMQPLVFTYIVRYEFSYGLRHVALARGALGGMAESVYLRTGTTSDNPTIILYDCDIKDYGCEAQVRSFGVPGFPDEYFGRSGDDAKDRKYTLNLEVRLTNGKIIEFNYDITDQIQKQPRGGVITITDIRINDEDNQVDSNFDVNISDWGNVQDIDLPLG